MFSKITLVALTALLSIARADDPSTFPNVDVTREECYGPSCTAYLLTLPLDGNSTINQPASSLYLTGVNNPEGGLIDINKIQCSYGYQGQSESNVIFTNKDAAQLSADSVEVEWISCSYNRATPGKF